MDEVSEIELIPSVGTIPKELADGIYFKNGPGTLKTKTRKFYHWFDGLAFIQSFRFHENQIVYSAKYLKSTTYKDIQQHGDIKRPHFHTVPIFKWWEYIREFIKGRDASNNNNVSITRIGRRYYALTESKGMVEFDPISLETLDTVAFDDKLNDKSQITTAHPISDQDKKEIINLEITPGRLTKFTYYSTPSGETQLKRSLIASIESQYPSYTHSFALSRKYVLHMECPLVAFPVSLLLRFGWIPYISVYKWKPEFKTKIKILDRDSGNIVSEVSTDALFAFHHVNAIDSENSVTIDLCAYPSHKIVDSLSVDNLTKDDSRPIPEPSNLTRLTIDIASSTVSSTRISDNHIELPIINEEYRFKAYTYCYGVSVAGDLFDNTIIKINVNDGTSITWQEDKCYAGEPYFVQKNDATQEDDGYLISLVTREEHEKSFLLILDAKTLHEECRVPIPGKSIPGFHGQYYKSV